MFYLKVLYITHVDMKDCSSGSSVRPIKILNAFNELGWQVDIVAGFSNPANIPARTATVRKFIKKLKTESDYDFCYIEPPAGPMFTPADLSLMKLVHKKKIPTAIFYRDAYWKLADWFKNCTSSALKTRVICAMQKYQWEFIQKYCDVIYGSTESFCEAMEPIRKMKLLPPAGEILEKTTDGIPNKKRIVYAGSFSEKAGGKILIDAMEIVNRTMKIDLELVCRKPEFDSMGIDAQKYSWLHVRHIFGEELNKLYLTCDCAVIPREFDLYMSIALPVKLLEYISYGFPVVASDINETTKFIKKYDIGLVCDCTAQALAESIIKIYSDEKQFKKYHDNAIKALMSENLWTHRAQQIAKDCGK